MIKFTHVRNIMNLNLMKCYKVLLTKDGIMHNIGSYIVLVLILFYFISLIVFYKKDLKNINIIIEKIVYMKKNNNQKSINIETNATQKGQRRKKIKRKSLTTNIRQNISSLLKKVKSLRIQIIKAKMSIQKLEKYVLVIR